MSKKVKMAWLAFPAIMLVILVGPLFTQKRPDAQSSAKLELDYGLVWYGPGGQSQKAEEDIPNCYFDPAKPTIIFIHGRMPDQVGEPPTFMVGFPVPEQNSTNTLDVAAYWVDAG